jgi:four helix bundle protein
VKIADLGLRIADWGIAKGRVMNSDDMKSRTKQFALRCIHLAESLPDTKGGRTIANQLARCGSSVGANYRAACRARSRAEFLSKMGIVEEEADECGFWLEMIIEGAMKPARLVMPLHVEADEIVRIIVSSIRTARSSRSSFRNPQSAIRNS